MMRNEAFLQFQPFWWKKRIIDKIFSFLFFSAITGPIGLKIFVVPPWGVYNGATSEMAQTSKNPYFWSFWLQIRV